jgi:hypothetical protein
MDGHAQGERGSYFSFPAVPHLPNRGLHLESAERRVPGVIRIVTGGAKHPEDSIPNKILNAPLLAQDRVDHRRQVVVEHSRYQAERDTLAERGEPAKVGHHDRHLADVPLEPCVPSQDGGCREGHTVARQRPRSGIGLSLVQDQATLERCHRGHHSVSSQHRRSWQASSAAGPTS